jgi:hypothetical protein
MTAHRATMPLSCTLRAAFGSATVQRRTDQFRTPDELDIPQDAEVRIDRRPARYFVTLRGEVFVSSLSFQHS